MDPQIIANFIAGVELMHPGQRMVPDGATINNRNGRLELVIPFHMEPIHTHVYGPFHADDVTGLSIRECACGSTEWEREHLEAELAARGYHIPDSPPALEEPNA